MNVTKISTKKISEQVVEQIEQWILSGSVSPGDKLPSVRELCDLFQVGRSAVRDAITTLKGRGIVEVRHGEGTFVCQLQTVRVFEDLLLLNQVDIQELFAVRKMLEMSTAELAALYRQDADLYKLELNLYHINTQNRWDSWEADYTFHITIAEATQNKFVVQLMEAISTMMKKALIGFHQIIAEDSDLSARIHRQHTKIFEAIKASSSVKAREAMLQHLNDVEKLLLQSLGE